MRNTKKTKNLIGPKIKSVKKVMKVKRKLQQNTIIEETLLKVLERRKAKSSNLSIKQINTSEAQIFNGIDELSIMTTVCIYWKMGASNAAASVQSGTTPSTLSRYVKNNPEWKNLRDILRETPFVNSQIAIAKRLEYYANSKTGEIKESLKYAQAVKGDGFLFGTEKINREENNEFEKYQDEAFALMDNDIKI